MKGLDAMQVENVSYHRGAIIEVRCRHCESPIRTLMPDETGKRMVLACQANYCEVLMELDNKGAHVANMCQACADKITLEQLQRQYEADMEEQGLLMLLGRKVTKIAKIAPFIG